MTEGAGAAAFAQQAVAVPPQADEFVVTDVQLAPVAKAVRKTRAEYNAAARAKRVKGNSVNK